MVDVNLFAQVDYSRMRRLHFAFQTQKSQHTSRILLEELRMEVQRREQELMAMSTKMKALDEQHQDYNRHIAVLKESLAAKEEHYNMLQVDVEEMRQRLEEKNRMIEKKTQVAMQAQQERNRMNTELTEIKDHMDIKDRKINVLQRKVSSFSYLFHFQFPRVAVVEGLYSLSFHFVHLFSTTFVYFPHFSHFCSRTRCRNICIRQEPYSSYEELPYCDS
ncbi:ERC protein 2-like isoform X2 [Temnothorax curvispinosus]|uniref:ERC protein 2-like isoform X2 n=1 Tax=Temnothorax curvispinosus TaxID=300111 RepID=A0A6J1PT11_9HYME|nr:ERC protein 2-like isoform X2 [Temnothorax curvispinosus]